MRLLTLSAAVVVALTGCASISKQETRQLSLSPKNEGMLSVSGRDSLMLDRTGDRSIDAAYDCTSTKNLKRSASILEHIIVKAAESMSPDYLPAEITARVTDTGIDATFLNVPNGCTISTGKVSTELNQEISSIYAEYPQVAEELDNRERLKELEIAEAKRKLEEKEAERLRQEREAEARRLAAAEKRDQQRLKDEAYAKSPKGQMDSYSLVTSQLKICADNYLIRGRDAKTASANLLKEVQGKLGKSFDKNYFDKRVDEQYKGINKLLIISGVSSDFRQACRYIAASSI